MSLRELARRVDVSASSVSQIETGRIQPSVRTLYAIVSELGLSLDEIFELVGPAAMSVAGASQAPEAAVDLQRAGSTVVGSSEQRTVIKLGPGVTWERMTAWGDPAVEFMIAVYGPGSSSSGEDAPTHRCGREFALVLAGMLNVTVDGEAHLLGPGDAISFRSSTPHRLHNDGTVEVRAMWVTLATAAV
jgi:DNA-binding XRE family transcriptional regulator/mannose-6-phosphate isomerase-like protein (cupin superfamily)